MSPAKPHILVVDDDPAIREALAFALRDTYVVHTAASGRDACALLREHPIAAIVLDAILKDEHGLDLIADFRTLSPAPAVLLTGHSTEELAIRAVRVLEVRDYLKKPVKLPELRATLNRLVGPCASADAPLVRARRLMDEHPERPYTTASLAKDVGLSERHLRRCFREAYGKTPRRYLTELRMRTAAHLLLTTSLGIEQIALQVGYLRVATFNALFKRVYGVTPSEFRARHGVSLPGQDAQEIGESRD
jgi:YesN/AraC family two-component response regulator